MEYLAKAVDDVHGDEHLVECYGDCALWCSSSEKAEQEREQMQELYMADMLRDI